MKQNNIVKGENLMLFIKKDSKIISIAFATSHSLEISLDTREISTKDHGGKWQEVEPGRINWTLSSENLVANTGEGYNYTELVDIMLARETVDVVFDLEGNSADYWAKKLDTVPNGGWTPKNSFGYKGQAVITSISCSAPNAEYATMSVSLTGTGELAKVSAVASASYLGDD